MTSEKINYLPPQSSLSWDEYFMLQAVMASFKSKDPNTKVGCVFVDEQNHQISMGYNGFIAGIKEDELPWGNNRQAAYQHQKYAYVVHSEANAILHAKSSLKNSRVYVTLFPCHECAKMISTVGVQEVVYLSDKYSGTEENIVAKRIFEKTQVLTRHFVLSQNLLDRVTQFLLQEK